MTRLLTDGVFWNGFRHGLQLLAWHGGALCVEPFVKETASTVFCPGPLAVIKPDALDDFLLDDIEMISTSSVDAYKTRLDEYLRSSSLYYDCSDGAVPLIVSLGRRCQIIPIS